MQPDDNKPRKRGISFPLQMLLGLVVVGGLLYGIPLLLERLDRAWWLLPALFLVVPLAAVILDMAQGNLKPTPFNGLFAYLGYVFRTGFLLVIVLGSIGVMILAGPAWIFAIFFTIVDIVTHLLPNVQPTDPPILCGWAGIDTANCVPALTIYHILSAIIAYLAIRYGNVAFNYAVDWSKQGMDWFARQIEE